MVCFKESHWKMVLNLHRELTDRPELSKEEYFAVSKFCEILQSEGFNPITPFGGEDTAFFCRVKEGEGPRLALLAEYDALRGLGHACGHSASGAASLLTALSMKDREESFTLDLIGCPDEEFSGGKIRMLSHGVFDHYDLVMMAHMADHNSPEVILTALEAYEIRFFGKSSHAAQAPWEGTNALNGLLLMIQAINMMRESLTEGARIHGVITEGGKAANVIPDFVAAEYNFRHVKRREMEKIVERVDNIVKGTSMATGTKAEMIPLSPPYFELIRSNSAVQLLEEAMEEEGLSFSPPEILGASDIGNVSFQVPVLHPLIQAAPEGCALHTVEFEQAMHEEVGELGIQKAASVLIRLIEKILKNPQVIESIHSDWKEELKRHHLCSKNVSST